jgi:CBS domain containing-hemolysin-like protein
MPAAGVLTHPGIDVTTAAILFVACVAGTAFFSSSEAAIIALSKLRIRTLAEQGKANAQRLQALIQSQERLVGTILLAENALIIFAATIAAYLAFDMARTGALPVPAGLRVWTPWFAIGWAAAATTFVVVLLAEIIPKSVAASNAEGWALRVARPMRWMMRLLLVPVWLLTSAARVYVKLGNLVSGKQGEMALPLVTEDELRQVIADAQSQGGLQQEESEMIRSVIALRETTVREIMVPRIDMVCLSKDASFDEALRVAITEGHSRIPVYLESSDNIVGMLYAKDLLGVCHNGGRPSGLPDDLIRPAFHVPESKRVDDLLRLMRTEKVHLAVVLDEFGGTAGLVTIEDILEEIVGEIRDEYDAEEPLEIQPMDDGTLIADGRANIDDVSEQLGAQLPTDDFDTIGGFVVGLLGRPPAEGEEVTWQGVRLKVEEVEQRRVARVRIWRRSTAPLELSLELAEEPTRQGA